MKNLYFVFDVDGTICFNGRFIEEEILDVLDEVNKNHELIFASARPVRDLLPVVTRFKENILIGGNGSIVSDKGLIKVIDYISDHDYLHVKQIIEEYDLSYIIDGSFDYSAKVDSNNVIYKQLDPMNLAKNVSIEEVKKPIKIILIDILENLYDDIRQRLAHLGDNITVNYHHEDSNIDITACGINKYTTLKKLIGISDYIGYGNDINDYDLLKNAYKSYFVSEGGNIDLGFGVTSVLPKDGSKIASSIQSHYRNEGSR